MTKRRVWSLSELFITHDAELLGAFETLTARTAIPEAAACISVTNYISSDSAAVDCLRAPYPVPSFWSLCLQLFQLRHRRSSPSPHSHH